MNKKIFTLLFLILVILGSLQAQTSAQTMQILNKAAAALNAKGGASANFSISGGNIGKSSGTITIKKNKFVAQSAQATIWYNGKTQWTYMKSSNEVNVTTPNEAKQAVMNPYAFVNIYKTGYNMSSTTQGNSYKIHLTAQNAKRPLKELYLLINKQTYVPSQVKVLQGKNWLTINITNFKKKKISDSAFSFNSKEYPSAEVIDLR
uniref:LolA-like putative outer membrane lipoprotein chaperone n=2 Tax=unclassified Prevotella TaxID=2638335 RepID=A0AB33IT26_9BACT